MVHFTSHINNRVEENIMEALNSFNGIQKASPCEYFFTRLQARLANKKDDLYERISDLIAKPIVAVAIGFLLIINIFAIFYLREQRASHVSIIGMNYIGRSTT